MDTSKGLVVSALLVFWSGLVLGTLALAPFAESDPDTAPGSKPYSVTVPHGNVGDEVVYREYARDRQTANHTLESVLAFKVEGVTTTLDRAGVERETLVVYAQQDPGPRNRTYLDLESRAAIRLDLFDDGPAGARVTSLFGPVGDATLAVPDEVRFQGVPFVEGMDLTEATRAAFAARYGLERDPDRVILFNYQAKVEGRGVVNGMQGMAIRFSGAVMFTDPPPDGGENRLFGFEMPKTTLARFEQTVWVTDEVPYPVLVEQEVRLEELGQTADRYFTLSQWQPGDQTIDWTTPPRVVSYPVRNPDVERVPQGLHYPTGDGGLDYPMGQAYDSVRNDQTLAQFHVWRLEHEDYALVGATYVEVSSESLGMPSSEGRSAVWTFTFGELDTGAFYVVQSVRNEDSGRTTNREVGSDYSSENGDADLLPERPVTIDAVVEYWQQVRPATFVSSDANFFHWGVAGCRTAACLDGVVPASTGIAGAEVIWTPEDLQRVYAGHLCECSTAVPVAGSPEDVNLPPDSSILLMDVDNGTLLGAQHAGIQAEARLPAHEGGEAEPQVRRTVNFSGTTDDGPWILLTVLGAALILPPAVVVGVRLVTWWRHAFGTQRESY